MRPDDLMPLAGLFLAWAGYFALHSTLASLTVKRQLWALRPGAMRYYRLFYNVLATVLVVPLVWWTLTMPGDTLWAWPGVWGWLADGLAAAAAAGFLWTLRYYEGGEFLGLRQLRAGQQRVEDQEQFHISPPHRYVRHPWYSFGLVILWTRDMDGPLLVTIVAITVYLVLGSRLEERKLIAYHGDVYRRYRQQVPPFIPSPWRHLDRSSAEALVREASRG